MKEYLSVCLLKAVGRLPLAVARALGAMTGFAIWLAGSREAQVSRRNLALCQPQRRARARERLVRQSLTETGKALAEAAVVWHRPTDRLMAYAVEVEGEELLQDALAQGTGVLILAPHLGNWEFASPFTAQYGPLTALYQPPRKARLDRYILDSRRKHGVSMAPTTRAGVGQLLRALKGGEMVGILPDQVPDPGNGAEVAPFFGQPALTMTLVHNLVRRTGCRVLCTFAQRVPGGYRMVYLPADERVYADDVATAVAGLNGSVEQCVRRAPAQYQWEYKRFRRLPPEYPDPYRQ